MMTVFLDPVISAALWITVKASVLLALAAIVQAVMYHRVSAATRHLAWTLAIVGVLLLPILSVALPEWSVVTRPVATVTTGDAAVLEAAEPATALARHSPSPASAGAGTAVARPANPLGPDGIAAPAAGFAWGGVIAGVYFAGVIVMLLHLAMQRWSVRRLARGAADMRDEEWTRLLTESAASIGLRRPVRLLRSCEQSMPMAFGTRHPAILIPAVADLWPEDRRRAVVLHELAHVARFDCLTQSLAFVACALYWFHPATWWVARRLRIERELACDDRVIAAGAQARDYAGHLLEIAYSLGHHRAPALAVSMARPRQLEGRLLAVLDAARNRSVPALRVRVAGGLIAAALLLPLASATSTTVAVRDEDRSAPPVSAAVASPQQHVMAPSLKSWDSLIAASLERIVRAAAAAFGIPQDKLPGTWEIRPTDTNGTVHLRLVELNSSSGTNMPIDQLEGLSTAQLAGTGGPVQFRLRRDAGTFTFDGVFRSGVGAGTFSFTADPNFPAELAKRGFERPTASEQYQLARHDVGLAFVDELNKQGYAKPQTSELVRAGHHGVRLAYLREMGALGHRLGTLAPLITLKDHGVTPAYIRELADQGYKGLSADELRKAHDHGVSPEYVRTLRDAGYGSLTLEQLINAKDHGVSADFVRGLSDAGYGKLPLEQVIRVRDHGVSPEFVSDMRKLGYAVGLDELVTAKDHGISVDFVRELAALGYSGLPLDSLIRVRDHGVTPSYIQELKALGYDRLAIEDVVTLRDHGLTADRIRAANARAGTRLPIDMLKSFAAGGLR